MGTLQQGKWAVLRRHFVLIVLTFCTFWYFDFRSGDLLASVFLWNQSPNLPRTYLPMTNNCFLPYPIVSPFLSCQILTCLIKESISLCTFPLVSICFAFQHLLVVGKGFLRVRSHPVFWECTCTYFVYLFICEWNLHCAALTPEAVTKPMRACGIFHLKLLYMVQAF